MAAAADGAGLPGTPIPDKSIAGTAMEPGAREHGDATAAEPPPRIGADAPTLLAADNVTLRFGGVAAGSAKR